MNYGTTEETKIIDDNGSTVTEQKKFEADVVQKPVRLRYEIRHRTDKTDLEALTKLAKGLVDDFTKLDACLRLERTNTGEQQGYYTLVECYTVLKYN